MKYPEKIKSPWLREALISERVETEWGKVSLVQASLALLKAALQDADNQWFVLLSDSCAPIKPFRYLQRELKWDGRSRLYWETYGEVAQRHRIKAQRAEALHSVRPMYVRFHPQWWLLNRDAAEAVCEDDFTEHFQDVFAADEMYFGTALRMKGYPLDETVARRDITKVDWSHDLGAHPATFKKLTRAQAAEFALSDCFFARKFSPVCNLAKQGLHRE